MTESNDTSPTQPVPTAPLTPLTPASMPIVQDLGPITAPKPGIAFHERVTPGRGRSTATRVGVITRSPQLVQVGVAPAKGASPNPTSDPPTQ